MCACVCVFARVCVHTGIKNAVCLQVLFYAHSFTQHLMFEKMKLNVQAVLTVPIHYLQPEKTTIFTQYVRLMWGFLVLFFADMSASYSVNTTVEVLVCCRLYD